MVIPWSCSSDSASSRNAYSNGLPVRSHSRLTASSFPCGSAPVSASRRPTTVLLPWSTWPTMTTLKLSRSAGGLFTESLKISWTLSRLDSRARTCLSHVALAAQLLETVLAVLHAPRALGDILERSALQFDDDVVDALGLALDRPLAGAAAQAAVARAVALVVVQRDRRDRFALDVLPDVELGPIEQRVDAQVGARCEVGLELVPELRRLIAHVPVVVLAARREVT